MGKKILTIDTAFLLAGTTYGITNIQTVLGIVVLSLQVLWLLTKIIVKIVRYIKSGKDLAVLDDEVNDVINLIDQHSKKEDEDDE